MRINKIAKVPQSNAHLSSTSTPVSKSKGVKDVPLELGKLEFAFALIGGGH